MLSLFTYSFLLPTRLSPVNEGDLGECDGQGVLCQPKLLGHFHAEIKGKQPAVDTQGVEAVPSQEAHLSGAQLNAAREVSEVQLSLTFV